MSLPPRRLPVVCLQCGVLLSLLSTVVISECTDEKLSPDQSQTSSRPGSLLSQDKSLSLRVPLGQSPRNVYSGQGKRENGNLGTWNDSSPEVEGNCSDPAHPRPNYNTSCEYVIAECSHKFHLFNYLELVYCKLVHIQVLGVIILSLWITYLISLLATTVDLFFVPPLNFLAEKLKLSPGIAGITLLALGNAAPDIFVVYSGLAQNDLGLVLGSLGGGAIFITTIVLGTVVVVSKAREYKLDKFDIMRDILVLILIIAIIVGVACDGVVHLYEACILPLIYIVYIVMVVTIGYIRAWRRRKSRSDSFEALDETTNWEVENATHNEPLLDRGTVSIEGSLPLKRIEKALQPTKPNSETLPLVVLDEEALKKFELAGLSWPVGAHFLVKFIWFVQWPFSLLRWLTVPPFYHDGCWSRWHYSFAVSSPVPMAMLLLIAIKGWAGFNIFVWKIPLTALLVVIGFILSILLAFALRPKTPPRWAMQTVLVPAAFFMSIVWLNIIATEVVSVLQSLGLLLSIDTAILGLTILAVGNSVADWVADTVVAKYGKVEMAFASCFGSPLMSHVLGLSIALIIKLTIYNHGEPYRFNIHNPDQAQVKLAWIFLGFSLISSAILFPVFRFSPPRWYSLLLLCGYATFVLTAVLGEVGVIPVLM